jgi:Abscisic acid G-protein coupled receptor/The Golgi pH Regulator (GPHR) Family N-terminal
VSVSMLPASCMMCQQSLHLSEEFAKSSAPFSISLGLSCCLFALSVLEATPSSWLILLDNQVVGSTTDDGSSRDGSNRYLTVSSCYFLVLTAISIYVLVICPCMAGAMMMERVILRPDCSNLLCCLSMSEKPWWFKVATWCASVTMLVIAGVYKTILWCATLVYLILQACWRLCFKPPKSALRDSSNKNIMSLPLTKHDADATKSARSNSRLHSLGCLVKGFYELVVLRGGTFLAGCLIGVTMTIAVLHSIAPFIIEPKSAGNNLAVALSWISAIGIVVSACLNGFGSVSMPHSCLAGLYLDPIRPETVTKATGDLIKTQESLQARREQLNDIQLKQVSPKTVLSANAMMSSSSSRWAIIGRKRPLKTSFSGLGEEVTQRKRKILEEISFLEALVEEMKEDIEDMRYTQQMEAASRTTLGRVNSWLGVLFSVILLVRLYFAAMSIWHHWYSHVDTVGTTTGPSPKRDPVTTALLWLLGHNMVSEKEYDELSQSISLVLTAILSFTQVRTFLRTVGAMHRRLNQLFCPSRIISGRLTPRSESSLGVVDESPSFQSKTSVYMHILAALMASYFLACIVLTKAMLPWQYRSSFSDALGGFDMVFEIQSDMINVMFALAAVASATILAMLFGIQKQNAVRHNVSWLEDLGSQDV